MEEELAKLRRKHKQQGGEYEDIEASLKKERIKNETLTVEITELREYMNNKERMEKEMNELRASMQAQIDALQDELDNSEEARQELKFDLEEKNETLIQYE